MILTTIIDTIKTLNPNFNNKIAKDIIQFSSSNQYDRFKNTDWEVKNNDLPKKGNYILIPLLNGEIKKLLVRNVQKNIIEIYVESNLMYWGDMKKGPPALPDWVQHTVPEFRDALIKITKPWYVNYYMYTNYLDVPKNVYNYECWIGVNTRLHWQNRSKKVETTNYKWLIKESNGPISSSYVQYETLENYFKTNNSNYHLIPGNQWAGAVVYPGGIPLYRPQHFGKLCYAEPGDKAYNNLFITLDLSKYHYWKSEAFNK